MDFDLQPTLHGSLIDVRPLKQDDFDSLFAAANDPLIWEQHPDRDRYKRDVFEAFFNSAIESKGAFAVIDCNSGRVIGSSRYCNLNPAECEVEIGYTFLERAYWGGAYNGELKKLMLDHAFQFVDRVVFLVGKDNVRSQRALQKIGATVIGKKDVQGICGNVIPSIVFALHAPVIRQGTICIQHASSDDAGEVRRIMREAFAEYQDRLTPPTGALTETNEDVQKAIAAGGALLAYLDGVAVGTARYQLKTGYLHAQRIGTVPEYRQRGVSAALMAALEDVARQAGLPEIRLGVRASLPSNLRFYENLGYRTFASAPHPRGPDYEIWMKKRV
jgi:RimJ/RimL family protein N-acetyltransferase